MLFFRGQVRSCIFFILFLVWIVDINNIAIIFNTFCSRMTVIFMTQHNFVLYLLVLYSTYYSICDGSDICCVYYLNPDLRKTGPTSVT